MLKVLVGAAILAGSGLIAPLSAQVYDCAFSMKASNNGWLTDRYIFDYDAAAGSVTVLDGLIQYHFGNAIAGKVVSDTPKKLVFSWAVQTTDSAGQLAQMQFRAAYIKANSLMTVSGVPPGYSNTYETRGTCKTN